MVMFTKVFTILALILLLDYSTGQKGYFDSEGYYVLPGDTLKKDYEANGPDYRQKIIQ